MNFFTLTIGAAALFIAGCAAYFSVRGIALTFGSVSAFTVPIVIMASSLEFGKLVAASFLYRHWKTCNKTLRLYLLIAVGVLVCITSAGIYGYLTQAFDETLNQIEGYEKKISSLQIQQREYDRQIAAYRDSGAKGSLIREEKHAEERLRLESYIAERRKDIVAAEEAKTRLSQEADQTILGERERREAEKTRIEGFITDRKGDIEKLEAQKKALKEEVDLRIVSELKGIEKVNERISELDAAVKVYRDKGPGGLFKEDGLKQAAKLLETQGPVRESLRSQIVAFHANAQKARDDLAKQNTPLDQRITTLQKEVSQASTQITGLTTGGAEQADNIRTALENLRNARSSVDERMVALEDEIAEASRKITQFSETESEFGPDSSAELEAKKAGLLAKKEDAEQQILKIQGDIRLADIGSFKFIASAFDSSIEEAEATGDATLIREATASGVNHVVKWFILILVLVFDPLAVTLVVAFNASLMKPKVVSSVSSDGTVAIGQGDSIIMEEGGETSSGDKIWTRLGLLPIFLVVGLVVLWGGYTFLGDSDEATSSGHGFSDGKVSRTARGKDSKAFGYLPEDAFAAFAFTGARGMEEVGIPKIVLDGFVRRAPFVRNVCWDPEACGVANEGRFLYFLKFPGQLQRLGRESDVLFALVFPLENAGALKEFVLRQLDLKSASPEWRVVENISPSYVAVSHKSEHVSIGFDENCLVALTSWWSDVPSPTFLDAELRDIFARSVPYDARSDDAFGDLARADFDVALSFDSKRFFAGIPKEKEEDHLYSDLRQFLDFRLLLSGKMMDGEVILDGQYIYDKPVLEEGFGVRVAGELEEVRNGKHASALQGFSGEFMELFAQKFDFNTVTQILERVDLSQSKGFEIFRSKEFRKRSKGKTKGTFSLALGTQEPGGSALRRSVDLIVEALNPLSPDSGFPEVITDTVPSDIDNP
tara:strand:- start:1490 stop:4312 length:2823 start_codon:yes stop_codon:yes gene_type:complete